MEASFIGKMAGLKVPDDFKTFLVDAGVLDEESFALMAADEKEVKTEIIELAKTKSVKMDAVSTMIAVKKLWMSCRKTLAEGGKPSEGSTPQQDELPRETQLDLHDHWKRSHGFVTPEAWLLSKSLEKRLWTAANAQKPGIEAVLMEHLRLLSQKTRPTASLVDWGHQRPGGSVSSTRVELDQIFAPLEVYSRARAWFYTMAYVCIRKPDWMDLQTAIYGAEKIFDLVQTTSDGRAPPVQHFVEAWANTLNGFAEACRISGSTLKSCIMLTGTWEHKWKWSPSGGSGGVSVDLPKQLAIDVADAREQARQWQSMVDKQVQAEHGNHQNTHKPRQERQRGGGGHGGKGRKGDKGKGSGGNGAKGKNGKHAGDDRRGDHFRDARDGRGQGRDRSRDRR